MSDKHLWQGIPRESNGGVPTNWQDQHTEAIVAPLSVELNDGSLIAVQTAVDDTDITLTGGHGAVAGNVLCVQEDGHLYFGTVLSVATNVLTMDTPVDHVFTVAGAYVCIGDAGIEWDIVRIHANIIGTAAMDSGKFGDQPALTNGVVLRNLNGDAKNVANAKSNGELALLADQHVYDPNPPAAQESFFSKHVFGGPRDVGVVQRVVGDDNGKLQVLIQDNLTLVASLRVIAIGHVVGN
jgi:hypothetical protein